MSRPGFVLYEGPSAIQPSVDIVVILTTKSSNTKTGNIPQVWYLLKDTPPHVASREGLDTAICGGCPHRRSAGGSCYVVLHRGPLSVWNTYKRGRYGTGAEAMAWLDYHRPRVIRVGAYGDPMSAPLLLSKLDQAAEPHGTKLLGYTHQWKRPNAAGYQRWLMASVDSPADALRARSKGWRTFRTRLEDELLQDGETVCDAEANAATCRECRACDGTSSSRPSPVITAHGPAFVVNRYKAWRAR